MNDSNELTSELTVEEVEQLQKFGLYQVAYTPVSSNFKTGDVEFGSVGAKVAVEQPIQHIHLVSLKNNQHIDEYLLSTFYSFAFSQYLPPGSELVICIGAVMHRYNLACDATKTPPATSESSPSNSPEEPSTLLTYKTLNEYETRVERAQDEIISDAKSIFKDKAIKCRKDAIAMGAQWENDKVVRYGKKLLAHRGITLRFDYFRNWLVNPDGERSLSESEVIQHFAVIDGLKKKDQQFWHYYKDALKVIRGKAGSFRVRLTEYSREKFLDEELVALSAMFEQVAKQLAAPQEKCKLKLQFKSMSYPFSRLANHPHAYLFTRIMHEHFERANIPADSRTQYLRINFSVPKDTGRFSISDLKEPSKIQYKLLTKNGLFQRSDPVEVPGSLSPKEKQTIKELYEIDVKQAKLDLERAQRLLELGINPLEQQNGTASNLLSK